MNLEAEFEKKTNPMMLNLAFLSAILFCLKLTCPPTPVIEVFAKILPMISKVTSKNFPQRNPILVVPGLRRDPKHEPMDDMMMRNPILVIVGLRNDPKHKQMVISSIGFWLGSCLDPITTIIGFICFMSSISWFRLHLDQMTTSIGLLDFVSSICSCFG